MIHFVNYTFDEINSVTFAFETSKKTIHLLESDQDAKTPVAQAFGQVQHEIMQRSEFLNTRLDDQFVWLLYAKNGEVFELSHEGCQPVELDNRELHPPYVSKMKMRRVCAKITERSE